ncbi:MAG: hypothetical protein AAGC55_03915 [Myxococcota bacterium]
MAHSTAGRATDPRLWIYAILDVLMGTLYALVLFVLIPNRHLWVQILSALVVGAAVFMAVAMIAGLLAPRVSALVRWRRLCWWAGADTLVSAAFLAGVYGSFGQAAAVLALLGAALVIEAVALLPAFQLKFLLTRAGRRCFGEERG